MRRLWAAMVFLAVAGAAMAIGWLIEDSLRARDEETARARALALADGVRLRLESRIAANMQIAEGLATYVAAHPDLTTGDFSSLAASLMRHRSEVRLIGLARGTTIVAVYPLEGNEAVLGADYRDIPKQWPSVRQVRETGQPLVAGPVDLIQGGQAIIGRMPIFQGEAARASREDDPFWGIASIPLDMEALFAHAGLTATFPLDVAIRGTDGRGAEGAVFFGDAEVFERRPERLTVFLPGGTWDMAVAPPQGWPTDRPVTGTVFSAFLFGGLLMGGIGALATSRLLEQGGRRDPRLPIVLRRREAFVAHVQAEARDRRTHGRGLALLAFDLPPEAAATLSADACLQVCQAALRPDDALGPLGPGRFCVLLGGAGEQGASLAADFIRRALDGLDVAGSKARFATVVVGPEDADGESAVGRLEALLDQGGAVPSGHGPA